jgi:hypothetical protein
MEKGTFFCLGGVNKEKKKKILFLNIFIKEKKI